MSSEVYPQKEVSADNREDDIHIKIHNLLQNTCDLIYFKDLNSVFTLCSDSLTRLLSNGRQESIIGKSDFDFYDRKCAEVFFNDEQEIIRTGQAIVGKVESGVRDGETFWVCSSKLPLFDKDGSIVGTFGISRDITEQEKTKQALQKTNQKLLDASRRAGMAEIATNVIHNVGNVLTSVKVAVTQSNDICADMQFNKLSRVADLIDDNAQDASFFRDGRGAHLPDFLRNLVKNFEDDRAKIRKELADTHRHLEHITTIVAQQQEHATGTLAIERVDLSKLITDAISMSSSSLKRHNIELERDFAEGLIVETDKHRVLQIVVNLIRNAKHACLDSQTMPRIIKVSIRDNSDGSFCIRISDNGIGIASENLVKLFTYGFTTRAQGKGFGLHSCANSARELGGSLAASSDGPGKGASFVLTIPGKLK